MDITITGRNCGITDRFQRYATEKVERIGQLADRPQAIEVKVSRHSTKYSAGSGHDRVELTLIGVGPVVRAESEGSDKYAALDNALDKLQEQLRRSRDRRKIHRGKHRPVSIQEAATGAFKVVDLEPASAETIRRLSTGEMPVVELEPHEDEAEYSPVVIREKVFEAERMTNEEAVDRMELVGHDFYLFIDAHTDRPSVVYRRKGWNYGAISLDAEVSLPTVSPARQAHR